MTIDDGYVTIVDRKKELIINAAGKNMSPANIEQTLKASHALIGQAVVIGDRRPFNVALLVLDPDVCAAYAEKAALSDGSAAALAGRRRPAADRGGDRSRERASLARRADQEVPHPRDRLAARW